MTRIAASGHPGITVERLTWPAEPCRETVWRGDVCLGEIVYVYRTVPDGIEYGWKPATHARKLTTKREAIQRLIDQRKRIDRKRDRGNQG